MKTREEIITDMCFTWRHDYGFIIPEGDSMYTLTGMSETERQFLWNQMAQVYDNVIYPIIKNDK